MYPERQSQRDLPSLSHSHSVKSADHWMNADKAYTSVITASSHTILPIGNIIAAAAAVNIDTPDFRMNKKMIAVAAAMNKADMKLVANIGGAKNKICMNTFPIIV